LQASQSLNANATASDCVPPNNLRRDYGIEHMSCGNDRNCHGWSESSLQAHASEYSKSGWKRVDRSRNYVPEKVFHMDKPNPAFLCASQRIA
jgi:hypothetical protein